MEPAHRASEAREAATLLAELEDVRSRFEEADEVLAAIRIGAVDGVVVEEPTGERVYMLKSADVAQSILEQATEAIVVCDCSGRIVQASCVANEVAGLPVVGHFFNDVLPIVYGVPSRFPEASEGGVHFDFSTAIHGSVLRGVEVYLPQVNAEPIEFILSAGPIYGENRRCVGCVIMLADITKCRSAERAFLRSEELKRRALENSSDCVKVLNLEGQLLSMNQEGQVRLEISDIDSLLGTSWPDSFGGNDRELAYAAIETGRAGKTGRFVGCCRTTSGRPTWWDSVVTPILNQSGSPDCLLVVSREITEQKQAEDRLKEADRRKTEFLAMLGHELRNPMVALRGGLDLLAMQGTEQEVVELMRQQCNHLVRLVDDLLDMARIIQGKIELRMESVELSRILEQALSFVKPRLEERRHTLRCSLPSQPVRLEADPVRIVQILTNLLHNAARYTDPGGTIELTASLDGNRIVIRVRDNGIGIQSENLPRIFDLFAQGPLSSARSRAGLGVGLTLARTLVELHGGTIAAHSDGLGRGSEFIVRLPAMIEAGAEQKPKTVATVTTPVSGRRVLVVDDNAAAANILKLLLERLGPHDVTVAYSGEEALELAKLLVPDILFLDIGLPGIDGCEVAERLRRQPGLEQTLLVALTGIGQEEDRARSHRAGFDEHVVKPASVETLQMMLRHPKLPSRA